MELSPSPTPFVLGEEPGCEKPSIVVFALMTGRADAGAIVCTPAPEMLKAIVEPGLELANVIASRRVHDPVPLEAQAPDVSPVSLTVTVAAIRGLASRQRPARAERRFVIRISFVVGEE